MDSNDSPVAVNQDVRRLSDLSPLDDVLVDAGNVRFVPITLALTF